jgi:hypothetical protein
VAGLQPGISAYGLNVAHLFRGEALFAFDLAGAPFFALFVNGGCFRFGLRLTSAAQEEPRLPPEPRTNERLQRMPLGTCSRESKRQPENPGRFTFCLRLRDHDRRALRFL